MQNKLIPSFLWIALASFSPLSLAADPFCSVAVPPYPYTRNLTESAIAKDLGWIPCDENRCGGFYLEPPFTVAPELANTDKIQVTADQMLFAQHGTSIGQGKVTITRFGQQIVANKAYLARDPVTGKLVTIDMVDDVTLREPNSLVVAKTGHLDLRTKGESLHDILYRTAIYADRDRQKTIVYTEKELQQPRKIVQLSAWGKADDFKQSASRIYEFQNASYSTCPPLTHAWQVKASHIMLDKNTGRGTAKDARVYVQGVPIFYTPYLNFPIDSRRQTGFLTPTAGTSSKAGVTVRAPFYWNTAPNYDSTITPVFLSKRGLQLNELFRYLTPKSLGTVNVAVLPNDRAFSDLQERYQAQYGNSTSSFTQADLHRLEDASDTRKSLYWVNNTRFNDHWTANVDYSHVSDDYYLSDLNNNFDVVTTNQLLQQAEVVRQGQHWNIMARAQGYQTLHPVDQNVIQNQYTRLPQIVIDGDYPNAPHNLDFFIANDITHFDITNTPGGSITAPTGNRVNVQPGVSLPFSRPSFYITPRVQFAMTQYELSHVTTTASTGPSRSLPIVDIASGLFFDRNLTAFGHGYRQTLEPQIYYTYVPYKNQNAIPVFDTTVNTLTYDELFMYNRFSGLDRIGDANQISYGVATRFIDDNSGVEKLRAGIGQILYFRDRKVTLCSPTNVINSMVPCVDTGNNPANNYNKSPLSGILNYSLNPNWSLTANSIWDVQTNKFNNQSITLHYEPEVRKIVNLGYGYVFNGDIQPSDVPGSNQSNLSQTDFSFAWPLSRDWSTVGRWTQNWNHHHFQNLLYGLQYDSCCWAVRFVTGRAFANLSPTNTYQYNTQFFIQFSLKGLGNYGNADPGQLLASSVSGYQNNFGQDY
ncbi:MAG TPA: LPS assembly protein LptD [Gammaproteobacteria bacterium]|nr:LPS assembly protein LptD [Gammaproteobacteria bacterium]